MLINNDKIDFIYKSIKRDVGQSNLTFWKNIVNQSKSNYVDIFISVQRKAEKENDLDIIKFMKEVLTNKNK